MYVAHMAQRGIFLSKCPTCSRLENLATHRCLVQPSTKVEFKGGIPLRNVTTVSTDGNRVVTRQSKQFDLPVMQDNINRAVQLYSENFRNEPPATSAQRPVEGNYPALQPQQNTFASPQVSQPQQVMGLAAAHVPDRVDELARVVTAYIQEQQQRPPRRPWRNNRQLAVPSAETAPGKNVLSGSSQVQEFAGTPVGVPVGPAAIPQPICHGCPGQSSPRPSFPHQNGFSGSSSHQAGPNSGLTPQRSVVSIPYHPTTYQSIPQPGCTSPAAPTTTHPNGY